MSIPTLRNGVTATLMRTPALRAVPVLVVCEVQVAIVIDVQDPSGAVAGESHEIAFAPSHRDRAANHLSSLEVRLLLKDDLLALQIHVHAVGEEGLARHKLESKGFPLRHGEACRERHQGPHGRRERK